MKNIVIVDINVNKSSVKLLYNLDNNLQLILYFSKYIYLKDYLNNNIDTCDRIVNILKLDVNIQYGDKNWVSPKYHGLYELISI